MKNFLDGYPVIIDIPVAWGHMDAMGHVNNTVYFRYFEDVRVAYFGKIQIMEHMKKTGHGPILESISCKFRAPLVYPDQVSVGCKISELEDDRFTMQYLAVSHKLEKIAAKGEGCIVYYNYKEAKKATIPKDLEQKICTLEGW